VSGETVSVEYRVQYRRRGLAFGWATEGTLHCDESKALEDAAAFRRADSAYEWRVVRVTTEVVGEAEQGDDE